MTDYDLVRAYYFDPPAPHPHRVPSDEELIARYERRRVDDCILRGGDPVAEGLGPHGSMIGGPGKPTTIHRTWPERTTLLDPLPLSWCAYPRAQLRILPPGGRPQGEKRERPPFPERVYTSSSRCGGAPFDTPIIAEEPPGSLRRLATTLQPAGRNSLAEAAGRQRRFLAVFGFSGHFGNSTAHRIVQDRRSRPPEG